MLSSRATPARGALRRGRRVLPARGYARAAHVAAPAAIAVGLRPAFALGLRPAVTVGLRGPLPAFRFYSTGTETRSTTTSTIPPPHPAIRAEPKDEKVVPVPPPGTPAPNAPVVTGSASEKALEAADANKEIKKEKKKPTGPWYKRAWAVVKKEAAHYWDGTRLLGHEIKISSKLQWKVLNGGSLTRRERRQLKRTTTDLLRLLPFSVFVIIPFMEILLPVALKLFPNMLPSTFEGQLAKEEKERKLLRVRLEMAKFLQETVRDKGGIKGGDSIIRSDEFKEFFRKVRNTGESPSPDDIIRVAKLFDSEISLDNLSRPQLVSVCKYMNIHAFGTDTFLKHQIRGRLEQIRVDDMMIHAEGVDSLSTRELQQACQSRAIRFQGMSPTRLREELQQWIDLHYTNKISGVILILSRAFNFDSKSDDVMSALESTLASLPENLIDETELQAYKDDVGYKQKLEVLQQQQELIEDEAEQEQEEATARKEKKEAELAAKEAAKEAAKQAKEEEEAAKAAEKPATTVPGEPILAAAPEEPVEEPAAAEEDEAKMTKEQIHELAEALSILTAKSSIMKERDELQALYEDNLLSEAESKANPEEADTKSVAVSKRVRSMIKKIDTQLEKYDERVGSSLNIIHSNEKGQVALDDIKRALKSIKHAPPEDIIEALGKKLDVDQDGYVDLEHVLELAQDDGLGLGILIDAEATNLLDKGADIRHSKDVKDLKPKREDIVAE